MTDDTEDPRVEHDARLEPAIRKCYPSFPDSQPLPLSLIGQYRRFLEFADEADAAAGIRRVAESGICGQTVDAVLNGVIGPCCLPSGHHGWHREEAAGDVPPAQWTQVAPDTAGGAS